MQCRCRPLLSHVHALGLLRMITTRLPADGIGFRRPILFSGCRLRCASPVRFALWRRHLATWPAPQRASFAPDRSPKQSALTSRSTTTNPSSPVRHTPRSPRETKSRRSTHAAPKQPDASLEVSFPFSAFQPRCAVRGGQASGQSRFGVCSPACDPRVRDLRTLASPLRFFAVRMRCGTA